LAIEPFIVCAACLSSVASEISMACLIRHQRRRSFQENRSEFRQQFGVAIHGV
jgi:hypothetical protein